MRNPRIKRPTQNLGRKEMIRPDGRNSRVSNKYDLGQRNYFEYRPLPQLEQYLSDPPTLLPQELHNNRNPHSGQNFQLAESIVLHRGHASFLEAILDTKATC